MNKILIICNTQSYMITSLQNMFKELGNEVVIVAPKVDDIEHAAEEINVVLLYLDEDMAKDKVAMTFIKDKVVMDDLRLYAIGNDDELKEIKHTIPTNIIKKEYLRPINLKEVSKEIDEDIKENGGIVKKKILVVDDSGTMLWNVKGWLEDKYQVILANSGAMAIKYLSINKPDLMLLDYEMPVLDGKQVLEIVRSEQEFAKVPVIFLTNKNDRESVSKVTSLRPNGYLLKTMPPEDIVATIDAFFMKQKGNE